MLRLRREVRYALLTAPLSMTVREWERERPDGWLGRETAEGGCPHMAHFREVRLD